MLDTFEKQLRERFQTPEGVNPNFLSVATILIQRFSRMPERRGTADLPYQAYMYALPLFVSIRDVIYDGWGSIHTHVRNPNQFTLTFEIDHLGRTFEVILKCDAERGDSLSFAGYGYVTCLLENRLSSNPEAWQSEITKLILDNCTKYIP